MEDSKTAWQKEHICVISRLRHMLKEGLHTDVKFLVDFPYPTTFEAHKLILASGSQVFERMFYTESSEKTDIIQFPEIESLGFEKMLKYLYEDTIYFENDSEVFLTLICAEEFDVEPLKQICLRRLSELKHSPDNIWIALALSKYFRLETLEDHCVSFIIENAKDALNSEIFLKASASVLQFVLKLPLLRITEFELLYFVVKWAENQKRETSVPFKDLLRPLLCSIHFPSVGLEEFRIFVGEKQNVFNVSDRLAIIHSLENTDPRALPEWCCKSSPRCNLTEEVSVNLVDTSSRRPAYTSVVKWFECEYEIRAALKNTLYHDIQTMTVVWGNKLEDLPLICNVKITWYQGLSFELSSVKKIDEKEAIILNFDKRVFGSASRHQFMIRVDFKHPVRVFFLHDSKGKQGSMECAFLRARAMTSGNKKIILNKGQCVNNMTFIRRIQYKSTTPVV
ncbi:BTB/POZ domain-containing protein 3-like [Stegodyphus dumicola]|uniref:BTB/POZ domain-containing protein 3-like n=1 Tax=Stegodyphus dumicola TaxID=202533 RepID=UPI0015B296CE|nr:BTB/POZ domain-containing protein 3-like [Stegodyphus dumicola]